VSKGKKNLAMLAALIALANPNDTLLNELKPRVREHKSTLNSKQKKARRNKNKARKQGRRNSKK